MRTLDRSDLWFGVVLVPPFALAAFLLLGLSGDMVTSPSFWPMLLAVGFGTIAGTMRGPLGSLGYAPRFFSWFCIGVTAAALMTVGQGSEFSLTLAAGLGLGFVIIEFLSDRYGPKGKAEND